jgi:hypothetical protein
MVTFAKRRKRERRRYRRALILVSNLIGDSLSFPQGVFARRTYSPMKYSNLSRRKEGSATLDIAYRAPVRASASRVTRCKSQQAAAPVHSYCEDEALPHRSAVRILVARTKRQSKLSRLRSSCWSHLRHPHDQREPCPPQVRDRR